MDSSESELRAMGNTEQEKAEAMKRYIREVFILEYAKNFNKGLSEADIKFYGKIHFDRSRSDNELNMHCHLIVSRKDQTNKKKLSPLTNHKNTKKGAIKGGFDRNNLFKQAEQGFDKLFSYNRPLSESFEYYNTMKNGSVTDQLKMQEQHIIDEGRMNTDNHVGIYADKQEEMTENKFPNNQSINQEDKKENKHTSNLPNLGLSSALGLLTPDINTNEEQQTPMKKKIKGNPFLDFQDG